MDSIKLGILCKRWQWSDDRNYFYCHLLKANNKIKTCPDNYCAYETPQKVTNQMRTVIYKVVFLEKILKWSIKQNFSFFCSLLVYIIKFILIYMQLIVITEKFLKKHRFFWGGGGSYHWLFCIIHFWASLYPLLCKRTILNKNPLNISSLYLLPQISIHSQKAIY